MTPDEAFDAIELAYGAARNLLGSISQLNGSVELTRIRIDRGRFAQTDSGWYAERHEELDALLANRESFMRCWKSVESLYKYSHVELGDFEFDGPGSGVRFADVVVQVVGEIKHWFTIQRPLNSDGDNPLDYFPVKTCHCWALRIRAEKEEGRLMRDHAGLIYAARGKPETRIRVVGSRKHREHVATSIDEFLKPIDVWRNQLSRSIADREEWLKAAEHKTVPKETVLMASKVSFDSDKLAPEVFEYLPECRSKRWSEKIESFRELSSQLTTCGNRSANDAIQISLEIDRKRLKLIPSILSPFRQLKWRIEKVNEVNIYAELVRLLKGMVSNLEAIAESEPWHRSQLANYLEEMQDYWLGTGLNTYPLTLIGEARSIFLPWVQPSLFEEQLTLVIHSPPPEQDSLAIHLENGPSDDLRNATVKELEPVCRYAKFWIEWLKVREYRDHHSEKNDVNPEMELEEQHYGQSIDDWFTHSPDFKTVTWGEQGRDWPKFSDRAARALSHLYDATKKGQGVSPRALREAAGSDANDTRDIFKIVRNKHHPAWKTMIKRTGSGDDLKYWIVQPDENSSQNPRCPS